MNKLAITLAAGIALAAAGTAGTASAQAASGEQLFKQRCAVCHTVTPKSGPMAPTLAGVVGRKAGSAAFPSYSPALKGASVVWTKANLDNFLTNPTGLVPGTRMVTRVPDAAERAALIGYLATVK